MLYINHDHPLVQASLIIRRSEVALTCEPRQRLKREREQVRKHLDLVRNAQLHLAEQIKVTPGCWIEAGVMRHPAIAVSNHGTIVLFRPVNEVGRRWIEDNVGDDSQWFGDALAVEHRFAFDLIDGMTGDGLEVTFTA